MAKKKKHVCPEGLPGWVVTYGDMMSLLLTFFILLFSFSSVNAAKFSKVVVSLQGALGVLSGGQQLLVEGTSPHSRESKGQHTYMEMQGAAFKIEQEMAKLTNEDDVAVKIDKRGLVVMMTGRFLFNPGSADIRPEARPFLDNLSGLVASFPNKIRVEGHAAKIPTHTVRFPSNWELAAGRACAVVRYFIDKEPLVARRMSAVSLGDMVPVAPNMAAEEFYKNRRVEVIFERFKEEEEG